MSGGQNRGRLYGDDTCKTCASIRMRQEGAVAGATGAGMGWRRGSRRYLA